jgi:DNA repair exonuclease SbcCD nuclease subunit
MAGLPAGLAGGLRLGVAHGALRIEGRYQPEDHPIALDAARRLGLDYLALGHWHSTFQLDARTAYSGAPEPTGFGERDSGNVLLVDVEAGRAPKVRCLPVATLDWLVWEERLDADRTLEALVAECRGRCERLPQRDRTLLRLLLSGVQAPGNLALLRDLEAWLAANLLFAEVDATALRVPAGGGRLGLLRKGHPLLDRLVAALAEPEVALEGLGLPPAERSPEVLSEATVLLEELVEEIWL